MQGEKTPLPTPRHTAPPRDAGGRGARARQLGTELVLPAVLLVLAGAAWWAVSTGMSTEMGMDPMADPMADPMDAAAGGGPGVLSGMLSGLLAFLAGWTAMMAAMMLPAVTPAVRLYARAAARGRVAPAGWFVAGYLAVWAASGLPAYLLWEALAVPLMDAETWALRLAAGVLLAAGLYQVLPLKRACLRHCRSPMSYFLRSGLQLGRPLGAARAGATHGVVCLGCCLGLMAVLVTAAAMQPLWAAGLAAVVFIERNVRGGPTFAVLTACLLTAAGAAALIHPAVLAVLLRGV